MAKQTTQRLKGDVSRLERAIANVNRSINTNKKFAQGVDYSEELRAKSLAELKKDQAELKQLKSQLKETTSNLEKLVADERAQKGKKEASQIEAKYAKLKESLALQLDPTSASAQKIKDDMEGLVSDYQDALTSLNKRPTSLVSARAKLTGTAVPSFGTTETTSTAPKPTVVAGAKPDTSITSGVTAGANLGTGITSGGKTSSSGTTTGKVVPSTFNVGTFRQADEASMAKATGVTPSKATGVSTPLDTLLAKTDFWYDLPDYIFKLDPKLGELLVKAVNEGWDNEKFLSAAKLTPWYQKNASTVRTRIIDRAKYDELKAAGEDVSKTDYGLYLAKQMRAVKAKAKEIAGVTLTDEQAQSVASKIYDGFLDDDPLAINALITPFIGKVSSIVGTGTGTGQTGFSGQALQNYQTLQAIAKANGFTIKDILPNISTVTTGGDLETAVLQSLANGDIDINRVAQDARMLAAQGQPQYVRGLLSQGYDLENIYAPYRQTMASVLEVDPNTIDLNDNTLRMAITDKGDMNLYDFKKALRQDNRWQYTGQAKEEVSNAALKVLQDFGFQG